MSSSDSRFPTLTANIIVPASGTVVSIPSLALGRMNLKYDAVNYCNFTVSSTGDLTIDATGNDVNFGATDTIHVLNTTDASSTATGSVQTLGGMGVAKKLYVGTDLNVGGTFTCPGEVVYLDTDLSGPWGVATHHMLIPMIKYGKIVHMWLPAYNAAASVNTVINSTAVIPVAFRPDVGAGDLWLPIVVVDNSAYASGSIVITGIGTVVINVLPAQNFQAAGLAGFNGCCVTWVTA